MREGLGIEKLRHVYDRVARRYDLQHAVLTARFDQRGRRLLVEQTVRPGDRILDCGAGTGTTALLAAGRAAPSGGVVLFDLSEAMLEVARDRAASAGLRIPMEFQTGDMCALPFADSSFDVVLSTYSLCPVYDPTRAARELFRVLKPGGRLGVAHSTEPRNAFVRWLADKVENGVWLLPALSLGCRPVTVLPTLEAEGARVVFKRRIGVPLWPFLVAVLTKPAAPTR